MAERETGLTYPLSDGARDAVRTASGRTVAEVTLERVLGGEIGPDDLRVSPETLRLQAEFAEQGGNPQLADNLRRGAELVAFGDDELLAFYEALRPGRSTAAELDERWRRARGARRHALRRARARGARGVRAPRADLVRARELGIAIGTASPVPTTPSRMSPASGSATRR